MEAAAKSRNAGLRPAHRKRPNKRTQPQPSPKSPGRMPGAPPIPAGQQPDKRQASNRNPGHARGPQPGTSWPAVRRGAPTQLAPVLGARCVGAPRLRAIGGQVPASLNPPVTCRLLATCDLRRNPYYPPPDPCAPPFQCPQLLTGDSFDRS